MKATYLHLRGQLQFSLFSLYMSLTLFIHASAGLEHTKNGATDHV